MAIRATVLIPTHDHGPMLCYAARSALAQTMSNIEVFIVGDGASDATREAAARLVAEDPRVRFFDNPKGPNRGEGHRHAALQHAQGEIVCYLPDDDLWLPDHIETVHSLLQQADFAHTLPIWVGPNGSVGTWNVDLAAPFFRQMLQSGANRVPFGCGAHTLAMYRQLPGWRTAAPGLLRDLTDLSMWQQFLAHPACRIVGSVRPTAVTFPNPQRRDWSLEERVEELARWTRRLADPSGREGFLMEVLASEAHEGALLEVHAGALQDRSSVLSEELLRLREELEAIRGLPSWRVRQWVLRWPLAARLNLWVGRVLAGPADR